MNECKSRSFFLVKNIFFCLPIPSPYDLSACKSLFFAWFDRAILFYIFFYSVPPPQPLPLPPLPDPPPTPPPIPTRPPTPPPIPDPTRPASNPSPYPRPPPNPSYLGLFTSVPKYKTMYVFKRWLL